MMSMTSDEDAFPDIGHDNRQLVKRFLLEEVPEETEK